MKAKARMKSKVLQQRSKQRTLTDYLTKKNEEKKKKQEKLKRRVEELVERYKRKAGITKPVLIKYGKRGHRLADFRYGGKRKNYEIHINIDHLEEIYDTDPTLASRFLEYGVAHEVAHIQQVEEKGFEKMYHTPSIVREMDAERRMTKMTGMTEDEVFHLTYELEQKLKAKHGFKSPPPVSPGTAPKTMKGKEVARVMGWTKQRGGGVTIPSRNVTETNWKDLVPKKTDQVWIIRFDEHNRPIPKSDLFIPRAELENYYVVG